MPNDSPGGAAHPQMQENCPAADVFEYTTASADILLTELGGRCRLIHVLVGSGASLVLQTIGSGATDRTLTHINAGDVLQPMQVTMIRAATTAGLVLRCYK